MVICSLEVDDFIKELLEIHSPEDKVFFDQLRKIIQFVVKDSTRSLEPVWKIQDRWTNGAYVVQLHQTVISCVKEFTLQHVNYLINDIQVHISHITGCCALIS
jgi:ABC-type dipeptide/oligopeptide/nickel transport system ATPase subunit